MGKIILGQTKEESGNIFYIKDDDFNTWYYFKILLKFVIFLNGKIFLRQTKEESVKIFLGLRGYLISV